MIDDTNMTTDEAEPISDDALDNAQGAGFASWASQLKKAQKKQTQAIVDLAQEAIDD